MCKIMIKLKGVKSKPVSRSFDNIDRIPIVIENIGNILENNRGVVITPENRQKVNEQILVIYKKTRYFR